jgi:ubiquinone/menaquinone biosynthesis C-methylase UbiE
MARGYDARWRAYLHRSLEATLPHVPALSGQRVLDVGCGTGMLLHALAARGAGQHLVGVDRTMEMLAVARAAEPEGRSAHWLRGDAGAVPLHDGVCDVVVSTSALHYVRDTAAVLREWRRVLRPGGRMVITDWCGDAWTMRGLDVVLRIVDPAHHRVMTVEGLTEAVRAAGFTVSHATRTAAGRFWQLMTVVATRDA